MFGLFPRESSILCRRSKFAGGGILVNFQALRTICVLFMLNIKGDAGKVDTSACQPSNSLQFQNFIRVIAESFVLKERALGRGGHKRSCRFTKIYFPETLKVEKPKGTAPSMGKRRKPLAT